MRQFAGRSRAHGEAMETIMQVGSNICHQSEFNALFLMMPMQYSSLTATRYIALQRRIEDRLMLYLMDISREVSIHFVVQDVHAGDTRQKCCRGRLCVSATHVSTCPWSKGHVEFKMENVPLLKVKDMACSVDVGGVDDVTRVLKPGDRVLQKGTAGCASMLSHLLEGANLKRNNKVLLVDLTPNVNNQWANVAMDLQVKFGAGDDVPFVAYLGACMETRVEKMTGDALGTLLRTWWPTAPEFNGVAGSMSARESVPRPLLDLFTFVQDDLVIAQVVVNKFEEPSPYYAPWALAMDDAKKAVERIRPQTVSTPGGGPVAMTPDFTAEDAGGWERFPQKLLPEMRDFLQDDV